MKGLFSLRGGLPVALALGLVWACGSSSGSKHTQAPGGEAGQAGAGGESSAGSAGETSGGEGGAGGDPNPISGAGEGGYTGGAAGETGAAGEGGAAGSGPEFHGLYIGTDGLDANDGTRDQPFLTLAHALAVARAGDTVVFLDGTFEKAPAAIVPDGVNVMAEHSGAAKLACSFSNLFTFAGTSKVEGLEFDACAQPIVATNSGTLTMVDLYFVSSGSETGAVHIGGSVIATLSGSTGHVYALGGANLFFIDGSASLTVTAGRFTSGNNGVFSGNALFRTAAAAKLTLQDLTIVDVQQAAVSAADTSSVTLDHATFDLLATSLVLLRDKATFTAKNGTRLALKPNAAARYECLRSELTSGSITIVDSELTGCSSAINSVLPTTLTITGSKLHHNDGLAIDLTSYVSSAPVSTVAIRDTEISDNGSASNQIHGAVRINAAVLSLTLRGVTFKNNGGAFTDATGMYLSASSGSSFDFGTVTDAGLNTFQTNGLGAGIRLQGANQAGLTVQAVGNTWTASVQGANVEGKYVVPVGASKVLEVTGPVVTTGPANYQLVTTTTLRLAELL